MRKRNFKFRPKIDKQFDEYLCRKYAEGTLNIHQEAKRLRISRTSIYRHLHQAGLIRTGFWEKIKNYFKTNSYWGRGK